MKKIKLKIVFLFIIFFLLSFTVSPVMAEKVPFRKIEGVGNFLPTLLADPGAESGVGGILEKVFTSIIGTLTLFAGLMFIIYFILGAFNWITSAGKTEQIEKAKTQMSYAVIGLVVVVAAYSFIFILGKVIGLEILEPAKQLKELGPNK